MVKILVQQKRGTKYCGRHGSRKLVQGIFPHRYIKQTLKRYILFQTTQQNQEKNADETDHGQRNKNYLMFVNHQSYQSCLQFRYIYMFFFIFVCKKHFYCSETQLCKSIKQQFIKNFTSIDSYSTSLVTCILLSKLLKSFIITRF